MVNRICTASGALLSTHLVVGVIFMLLPGLTGYYGDILYAVDNVNYAASSGYFLGESMLLGFWIAFASTSRWLKAIGFPIGIAWVTSPSLSSSFIFQWNYDTLWSLFSDPVEQLVVLTLGFVWFRMFVAKLEAKERWRSHGVSDKMQLSVASILTLMALIGIVLLGIRLQTGIREWGQDVNVRNFWAMLHFVTPVICSYVLIWAALGLGRIAYTIPIALLLSNLIEIPFIVSFDPSYLDLFVEQFTTCTVAATVVLSSLLVIRSCGYRLVPVRRNQPELADAES